MIGTGLHRRIRRKSLGLALAAMAPAIALAAPLGMGAQEEDGQGLSLRGYPLAIHQGTCETVVAEPAYDLGFLVPRSLYAADDTAGTIGTTAEDADRDFGWNWFYADDQTAPQNELVANDTRFVFDDITGDEMVDYGLDRDGDGVLSEEEVIAQPIMWGYVSDLNALTTTGPGLAETSTDTSLYDLRSVPHVLMVHNGDWTDNEYMACGEIQGVASDEGRIVFGVRPVTDNSLIGIAEMQQATDGFLGIGGDAGRVAVWMMPSNLGQPLAQDNGGTS